MSRLIAFGCSNTYGQGLDDCIDEHGGPGLLPSKFAWPQLLADKLNLKCVNMGVPGASNKRIWKQIIDFDFQKDDKVFVLWSDPNRWCVFDDDEMTIQPIGPWVKTKTSKIFYKNLFRSYDQILDTSMRMSHVTYHLNNMSIENYHNIVKYIKLKDCAKNTNFFRNVEPFSNLRINYKLAQDKKHSGPNAHIAYVKQILKEIS